MKIDTHSLFYRIVIKIVTKAIIDQKDYGMSVYNVFRHVSTLSKRKSLNAKSELKSSLHSLSDSFYLHSKAWQHTEYESSETVLANYVTYSSLVLQLSDSFIDRTS